VKADRITVLPIRPELETFLSKQAKKRDTEVHSFLFIGRLSPEKNIPRIIRAFSYLYQKHPDTRLSIVGDGPEKTKIESLIHEHHLEQVVVLKSWTEDVAEEMWSADIFLLASLHEAYGLTLIEAMAVGMPIVTTDVGCVGEIVQNGVHGIVVKETSDIAFRDAMERMLTDGLFRSLCAENGRKTTMSLAEGTSDAYARAWVTGVLRGCHQV
jgi:glycosyltransferase involved in cell wall biosynthesis